MKSEEGRGRILVLSKQIILDMVGSGASPITKQKTM